MTGLCKVSAKELKVKLKPLPEQSRLLDLLSYDPATGFLVWKKVIGNRRPGGRAFTSKSTSGAYQGGFNGKKYAAHRIIWKMMFGSDPFHIDHIDGDPTNNRLQNLRSVAPQQNMRNRSLPCNSTSGVLGVSERADGKWRASITLQGKTCVLGDFISKAEAAAARKSADKVLGFSEGHGRPAPTAQGNAA